MTDTIRVALDDVGQQVDRLRGSDDRDQRGIAAGCALIVGDSEFGGEYRVRGVRVYDDRSA